MTIYKGQIPIAGLASPIAPTKSMGQIVESKIPLVDAGLHLLDGTLVRGDGVYKVFVDKMADLYTLDPTAEYFCTQEDWEDSVFNYGVCEKFVYDSTYNTVRLPKMYSNIRYLIKSYDNGTNWYRIYSDGWCEQGGPWGTNTSNWATASVTFLVPFLDTNFNLSVQGNWSEGNSSGCSITARSTTGFTGTYANNQYAIMPSYWQAQGYVDISTYKKSPNYLYIVLATASKTEIEVDIDEIITDLNGKADVDLTNVPTSKGILTESYVNGTSWYRVYSDGWCEQGGYIGTVTDTSATINLLKTYKDTNYSVLISTYSSAQNGHTGGATVNQKTVSSFTTGCFEYFAGGLFLIGNWQTSGYIR